MGPPRILLCGDVQGKLEQLFKRVTSVDKANGPFDAILCVGQFFPNTADAVEEVMHYVEGKWEVPLPTYFIGDYGEGAGLVLPKAKARAGNKGLMYEGIPVCKNLYWLKGSGVFQLKGLRVAYLAGRYVAAAYDNVAGAQSMGVYHEDDVDALRAFADDPEINDLFLSNEWPQGILNGVSGMSDVDLNVGSSNVAQLVAELKPRYHVAGSEGLFYTRDPYLNEKASHITRFISLAAVGNVKKQKYLHALSFTPAATMDPLELSQRPPNTTLSPFVAIERKDGGRSLSKTKVSAVGHESEGQYWRYAAPQLRTGDGGDDKVCFEFAMKGSCSRGDACHFKHDRANERLLSKGACFDFVVQGKCKRGSECRFRHSIDEDKATVDAGGGDRLARDSGARSSSPCWFCLSSPNVDTDLIINVGDHCYCAMAKGGLVDGHVLILPIEHSPSMLSLLEPALEEIQRYKKYLRKLYKKQGETIVVFERCLQFKGGSHAHLQVVPIPLSKASEVRAGFSRAAKELGFTFDTIRPEEESMVTQETLQSYVQGGKSYFFVELPEGTILAHFLDPGESMPMQFGREVCANLLAISERSDWRACKMSKDEELAVAEKLKEAFKDFDGLSG